MLEPVGSFSGVTAKFDRAGEHFHTLGDEILAWGNGDPAPLTLRSEPESAAFQHRIYVRFVVKPNIVRWGLLFGDGVHNLRSALDHLVYALAVRETGLNPPPKFGVLQFPIRDDLTKWTDNDDRLHGLSQPMRAFIKSVQPFQAEPQHPHSDRLWTLSEFDNADKHRAIRPVGIVPNELELPMGVERGGIIPIATAHNVPLDKNEAMIATVTGVSRTKMQDHGRAQMTVGVEDRESGAAIEINAVATEMLDRVAVVIRDAQVQFFPETL